MENAHVAEKASRWRTWGARPFTPVSLAPLVWFRVAFGSLMLWDVWHSFRFESVLRQLASPRGPLKYHGFEWVKPWPLWGMKLHVLAMAACALGSATGTLYRLSTLLFFLLFSYVFLLDAAQYLNHFYLIALLAFLLMWMPAHRALSIDAWLRPRLRARSAPAWTLWLLRFQISVVYFYGGLAKLNADWLRAEPMRTWLAHRVDYPLVGPWLGQTWVAYALSYGGLLFDLAIVPLLWWRRTRTLAFALALAFNLCNAWLFTIGVFPWLALGATVLLFAEGLPQPWDEDAPQGDMPSCAPRGWRRRVVLAGLGVYVAWQLLMPLRHWLYPGDVAWTEQGHRFAWRMKLRTKSSRLTLIATDPVRGDSWPVALDRFIDPVRLRKVAGQPDLLLQLCAQITAELAREGRPGVQLRARAISSLNGRPPGWLVDPEADLASRPRSLWPSPWITRRAPAPAPWAGERDVLPTEP